MNAFMLCVHADDCSIVPSNIRVSSIKSLFYLTGGILGKYNATLELNAIADSYELVPQSDTCCVKVSSNPQKTIAKVNHAGGYYLVWINYLSACCSNGRAVWESIKDLLEPHEIGHRTIFNKFQTDYLDSTGKNLLNDIYAEECANNLLQAVTNTLNKWKANKTAAIKTITDEIEKRQNAHDKTIPACNWQSCICN